LLVLKHQLLVSQSVPLLATKKETIVKIKITKDGKDYIGEGTAKTTVKSTFIELKDSNLPFEKTTFASAVKKSIVDRS